MPTQATIGRITGLMLVSLLLVTAAGCNTTREVVLREQAERARTRGQMQSAQEKYEKLVEMNSTSAQYQYGLGATYLSTGELDKARIALEQARALAPNRRTLTPNILDKLAETYYRQDDRRRLTDFLLQSAKERGTARAYLRQATYLRKLGDMDAARTAYRKAAIFAGERNPRPYLEMADFYQSIGDRKNAVKSLRYAHHIAPENRQVAQRLQAFGIEPGPQAAAEPPPKPALLTD
jgi:Flp pilus assembly protein TadD